MIKFNEVEKLLLSQESIKSFNKMIYYDFQWHESFYNEHDWITAIRNKDQSLIINNIKLLREKQLQYADSVDFFGIENLPLHPDQERSKGLDHVIITTVKRDTSDFIKYLTALILDFAGTNILPANRRFEYMFQLDFFKSNKWNRLNVDSKNELLSLILGISNETAKKLLQEIAGTGGEKKFRLKKTEREFVENQVNDMIQD
jgi:hypothetical protein